MAKKKKSAKKSAQIRKKEKFIRIAQAPPVVEEKKSAFKVKRIRMLMSVANEKAAFTAGHVYKVGEDITPKSAESYIRTGAAEEDTSLAAPEETKETITHLVADPTEEPVITNGEYEIEVEKEEEEKEEEKEEAPKEEDEEAPKEEKAEETKEEKVEIEKK